MVDYVAEVERLAEESLRRMSVLREELEEIKQETARRDQEFSANLATEMSQFWQEYAETEEAARAEAEEKERLEAEAREQREAIARSIAARKAHELVTPVDEDDDPEGEYYRRKSWLI
ncbi:hypothetical protein [Nocardia sp. NBC_01009]|uniref:hypothetical protein n=1 Tax=Nocardia sp. NBC_01009 TaxID=2975996 RepID=UPI00386D8219|nr:hypothetical protein OHA42_10075 [Nocardia sp. NBC_01009]